MLPTRRFKTLQEKSERSFPSSFPTLAGRPQQRLRDIASNDNSHSRDHQIYPDHHPKRPGSADRPAHQSTPARNEIADAARQHPAPYPVIRRVPAVKPTNSCANSSAEVGSGYFQETTRPQDPVPREQPLLRAFIPFAPDAAGLEVAIRYRRRARHCSTLRRCTMRSLTSVMP